MPALLLQGRRNFALNVNLNNLDDYQEKSYSKDKHIMSLEIMCQECKWKFDQILIVGRLKEIIYVAKSLSKFDPKENHVL